MTNKLTKDQAIIITGFTGVLCCEFSDFHADVERRKGAPVWTHEFASNKDEVRELYRADFMALLPMDKARTEGNRTPIDGDQKGINQ